MNSPLSYIGGKSRLSKTIIPLIPEHSMYCEVFAGAAWVFFRKEPSRYEVINDLDGGLVAFYRVLQNHLEEFLRQFKWLLSSHEWWGDWQRQFEAGGLTDIQKAARYYYIQRHGFGGKVKGKNWGAPVNHSPRINLLRMEEELSAIHLRLARVTIENMDYETFIRRYDRAKSFYYLDPPYFKFDKLDDFKKLAGILKKISGKFILSINNLPEMRECFSSFDIRRIKVDYSASGKQTTSTELLIKNF
jgi:DNA adenine methylase